MSSLICKDEQRRDKVRKATLNGLDYVEVSDDRRHLTVFLLGKAPRRLRKQNITIEGGRRIRDIRVIDLDINRHDDPEVDDCLVVTVDRPGDFSTYQLCVRALDREGRPTQEPLEGFDRRYACVDFSFLSDCPSELDCKQDPVCPPEPREEPELHYLAKDYASFRQLILDRLSLIMPDWRERHIPDIGITLVEILAYVGDHLSYYQDAVATEAYLDTARERISIRRHARLVDYFMHEGCNARAWVVLETTQSVQRLDPDTIFFLAAERAGAPAMRRAEDLADDPIGERLVFEPIVEAGSREIVLRAARNAIRIYTWGDTDCCLPRGSTSAELLDPGRTTPPAEPEKPDKPEYDDYDSPAQYATPKKPRPRQRPEREHVLELERCDVLIFEEVRGPKTGAEADADPKHRHAVRLTKAERDVDPLTGQLIWHVEWSPEDALPFPVCVSSTGPAPDCEPIDDVTIVRGNVVLVDHGERSRDDLDPVPTATQTPPCCDACEPFEIRTEAGPFRPMLHRPHLTHREPPAPCRRPPSCETERTTPAAWSIRQDPRKAKPQIVLSGVLPAPDGSSAFAHDDLLDSSRLARRLAPTATGSARWLREQLALQTLAELDEWHASGRPEPVPAALLDALRLQLARLVERWEAVADLLDCGADDRHFVVEMDEERRAHLRFGDGDSGCRPAAGTSFRAAYRLGNGTAGNVGAESIRQIVFRSHFPSGVRIRVRNPMPASGGTEPESVREVKAFAPHAFRRVLERAITADDYAAIVMRDFGERVQRAAATIRWTGSHPEVLVAIDPRSASAADATLLCEIEKHLEIYRRIGHDVRVRWAKYVSLNLTFTICVLPGYLRGHVKAALLDVFSSRRRRDGQPGFFHPDRLSFGESIQLSELIAKAQSVDGVESVRVDAFERLYEGPNGEIEDGVLPLGPLEVARLENDPNQPEHGLLHFNLKGGR